MCYFLVEVSYFRYSEEFSFNYCLYAGNITQIFTVFTNLLMGVLDLFLLYSKTASRTEQRSSWDYIDTVRPALTYNFLQFTYNRYHCLTSSTQNSKRKSFKWFHSITEKEIILYLFIILSLLHCDLNNIAAWNILRDLISMVIFWAHWAHNILRQLLKKAANGYIADKKRGENFYNYYR